MIRLCLSRSSVTSKLSLLITAFSFLYNYVLLFSFPHPATVIPSLLFFFFLMSRRPPRSPLFPHPPLSRSSTRGTPRTRSRPFAARQRGHFRVEDRSAAFVRAVFCPSHGYFHRAGRFQQSQWHDLPLGRDRKSTRLNSSHT